MPKSFSIDLGDHLEAFIAEQVATGQYASAADVLVAGLQLLEAQEARSAALLADFTDDEENGPSEPFYFDAHRARKRAEKLGPEG